MFGRFIEFMFGDPELLGCLFAFAMFAAACGLYGLATGRRR